MSSEDAKGLQCSCAVHYVVCLKRLSSVLLFVWSKLILSAGCKISADCSYVTFYPARVLSFILWAWSCLILLYALGFFLVEFCIFYFFFLLLGFTSYQYCHLSDFLQSYQQINALKLKLWTGLLQRARVCVRLHPSPEMAQSAQPCQAKCQRASSSC